MKTKIHHSISCSSLRSCQFLTIKSQTQKIVCSSAEHILLNSVININLTKCLQLDKSRLWSIKTYSQSEISRQLEVSGKYEHLTFLFFPATQFYSHLQPQYKMSFVKRNLVLIVMLPVLGGIHFAWMQMNDQKDRKELPIVSVKE